MQGFNMGRYVPPDQEGVISGNALNKKHPLGARASKLASQGILTVRFEMPFAVWCSHCPAPTIIGQGVRFNAEKKRVGYYHSSPIFSFRIKHNVCGGEIEIRTDPQNTRYVVVSGGKARDTGSEEKDDSLVKTGVFAIPTPEERADLRESAFGKLEKTIADREQLEDARQRINELQDTAHRQWEDPYAQNSRLRKAFRVGRHEREKEAVRTEDLRDRMSLGIELLPGTEEDARRAALVDFGRRIDEEDKDLHDGDTTSDIAARSAKMDKVLARPLFDTKPCSTKESPKQRDEQLGHIGNSSLSSSSKKKHPSGLLKSEIAAARTRENLISEIVGNTRATKDPFLDFDFTSNSRKYKEKGSNFFLPGFLLKKKKKKKKRSAAEAELDDDNTSEGDSGKTSAVRGENSPTSASAVVAIPAPSSKDINENNNNNGNDHDERGDRRRRPPQKHAQQERPTTTTAFTGLVSYGSDSDYSDF
ncbi:DUF572 domain containing protein [Rhypophila decipiens]